MYSETQLHWTTTIAHIHKKPPPCQLGIHSNKLNDTYISNTARSGIVKPWSYLADDNQASHVTLCNANANITVRRLWNSSTSWLWKKRCD